MMWELKGQAGALHPAAAQPQPGSPRSNELSAETVPVSFESEGRVNYTIRSEKASIQTLVFLLLHLLEAQVEAISLFYSMQ